MIFYLLSFYSVLLFVIFIVISQWLQPDLIVLKKSRYRISNFSPVEHLCPTFFLSLLPIVKEITRRRPDLNCFSDKRGMKASTVSFRLSFDPWRTNEFAIKAKYHDACNSPIESEHLNMFKELSSLAMLRPESGVLFLTDDDQQWYWFEFMSKLETPSRFETCINL